MYFKEKEDTNIDAEFESKNKFNFDLKNLKLKPILFIAGGIILLIVVILIISSLLGNKPKYTIELIGGDNITISKGETYIEPGYKAYNKSGKDYTEQVEIISTIDNTKAGTYEVLYSIGGVNVIRKVTVVEIVDETYIYLKGNINTYLELGEKYKEPGFEVYDSIDGDLTSTAKVTNNINIKKIGTYQVTYSVTNSRNKTTTVKRNIIVVAKGKKPKN